MSYVSHVAIATGSKLSGLPQHTLLDQVAQYEDSVGAHLSTLLESDHHSEVIASAKYDI